MTGREPEWGPTAEGVAKIIREQRELRKLSYTELSRLVERVGWNLSPVAIRRIEDMERRVSVDDLDALATVFDMTIAELLPKAVPAEAGRGSLPAEEPKDWHLALAGRVGAALRALRKDRKLSATQLAEKTSELGFPLHRVAITKIETNGRAGKLDLSELVILALALEVAPSELAYPDKPEGQSIRLWPRANQLTAITDAAAWFSGYPLKTKCCHSAAGIAIASRRGDA